MPSIESSPYPLVFRVRSNASDFGGLPGVPPRELAMRTEVRSLEGMQKEALVSVGEGGRCWRMVSDEGPYLNGTDLAPFPLAFYTAGMQFSFISQLIQGARARNVDIRSLTLEQDNRYSMNGSFIRGDAIGGAMPADLKVSVESNAEPAIIRKLVLQAEAASPAQAMMRKALQNTFALRLNGDSQPVTGVKPSTRSTLENPTPHFDTIEPTRETHSDIIAKVKDAETVHGVEGGAGSSFKPEQKRTLHIHGRATLVEGMRMQTLIELFKPIGSSFRFECDELVEMGGDETAPPPLAYLTAGVGFCYMTQLGRYAIMTKRDLAGYGIVQDNVFHFDRTALDGTLSTAADPFDTHVFIEGDQSAEVANQLVSMSERTCFLHAAMRGSFPSKVTLQLNGANLPLAE